MPSSTRYYGIGFFDFGPLGTDFNSQVEISRFAFLDKILYGLMSIFGNGVVSGWTVTASEAFVIGINEGYGNINFMSARTTFPTTLDGLPRNSIVYIYAQTKARTTFTEEVEFLFDGSANLSLTNLNTILLSKVTLGNLGIEAIDNTVRQDIGFIELIKASIRTHKHRGGSLYPSKIDLASEVQGQLPSFRIADFDAEKIVSGTFDLERLPLLDHSDLLNVGLLTHPQLDSFVKTLDNNNTELFGEIGVSNWLQQILAAKLLYEDVSSSLYSGSQIDEFMVNEFAVIPGVTPNSRIDFDNTTAEIDLNEHFIRGIPPTTGTSFFVNYNTALAWKSQFLDNLIVVGDSLTLAFDPDQRTTTTVIEDFESSTKPEEDLSPKLFKEQNVTLVDKAMVLSNNNSSNITDGFYSGQFTHQQTFRVQFVKEFSTAQDWSQYDVFTLQIKCLSQIHGSVKLYFTDTSSNKSPDFVLLEQDEITSQFEARNIDLTTINFLDKIKSIVIYSDDHVNDFSYFIDNMNIQKALLLPEEGTMRLRYSTGSSITFGALEWISTEPVGTEIEVRARSANGTVLLNRANFTDFLNSGHNLNLQGTDLEVEFTFTPDDDRLVSPTLHSVRLTILTEAEIDGFSIDTSDEFGRGDTSNTKIVGNTIELDTPIYVDSIYFILQNGVHQGRMDGDIFQSGDEPTILGTKDVPISPNHVFKAVEEGSGISVGLFEPRSVVRQSDRSFVVADTFADRVLQLNEDGELLSGFGSINYAANTLFPIAASVDIRTGILYLVWSKKVSFKTINVSKITLQSSTQKVQLIKDFDKILGLSTADLQRTNTEGQIVPIHLSSQNAGLAQVMPTNDTFLQVDGSTLDGVIPGGVDQLSIFYATLSSGLGIPCYIGNFAYIDGVFCPTYANKSLRNGTIVTNASIAIKDYNFSGNPEASGASVTRSSTVSNVIEIDDNNNQIFGLDKMFFSPFIPGRVYEKSKSQLLIGGIRPGGTNGTIPAGQVLDFRTLSGDNASQNIQKETLNQIFFKSATPHVGSVIVYDRTVNTTLFEYTSPEGLLVSDVDIDNAGKYTVAESSFDRSGRIIKLDTSGNITFSVGEGLYSLINDVRTKLDGSMIIST